MAEDLDEQIRENARQPRRASADALSADAAGSSEVRRTLRNRARYEVANSVEEDIFIYDLHAGDDAIDRWLMEPGVPTDESMQ